MSIMSSVSVAVSMTHDDEKMKRSRVVTVGSPTLGGGEGAGRRRTITSYFVVVTSVCSLLSNGMSGMRMSNESPPHRISNETRRRILFHRAVVIIGRVHQKGTSV